MVEFLQLDRETRDLIIEQTILLHRERPSAPPTEARQPHANRSHQTHRLYDKRGRFPDHGTSLQYEVRPGLHPAEALGQTCKQLHAEVLETAQRLAHGKTETAIASRHIEADVLFFYERDLFITFLSYPMPTASFETCNVEFRFIGGWDRPDDNGGEADDEGMFTWCGDTSECECNQDVCECNTGDDARKRKDDIQPTDGKACYPKCNPWLGDSDNPSWMVWLMYASLERLCRAGPSGIPTIKWYKDGITCKEVSLDSIGSCEVLQYPLMKSWWCSRRSLRLLQPGDERPADWKAAMRLPIVSRDFAFSVRAALYMLLKSIDGQQHYARLVFECLGAFDIKVNGVPVRRFDLAFVLRHSPWGFNDPSWGKLYREWRHWVVEHRKEKGLPWMENIPDDQGA